MANDKLNRQYITKRAACCVVLGHNKRGQGS